MIISVNMDSFSGLKPDVQGVFIFDLPFDEQLISAENIICVVTTSRSSSLLLWSYWYNYKVPAILKKFTERFLLKSKAIVTLSGFTKPASLKSIKLSRKK